MSDDSRRDMPQDAPGAAPEAEEDIFTILLAGGAEEVDPSEYEDAEWVFFYYPLRAVEDPGEPRS